MDYYNEYRDTVTNRIPDEYSCNRVPRLVYTAVPYSSIGKGTFEIRRKSARLILYPRSISCGATGQFQMFIFLLRHSTLGTWSAEMQNLGWPHTELYYR